jgi:hypothetical protein
MASDTEQVRPLPRNAAARELIPLQREARSVIPTSEAAAHLGRSPQTLRLWACKEIGPLRPVRVNGRLGWRVDDLRRVLEIGGN